MAASDLRTIIPKLPLAFVGASTEEHLAQLRVSNPTGSRFDWVLGLFYMDRTSRGYPDNLGITSPALFGPAMYNRTAVRITNRSLAPFAQATYEILPKLKLTAGLRFTTEKAESDQTVFTAIGRVVSPHQTTSYNKLTWRLAADYEFVPDVHAYISYNRGLKSGGFNQAPIPYPPYRPEILDAYEIGLKSKLFDNRVRLNVAGFYYDYKDIQENGFPGAGRSGILQRCRRRDLRCRGRYRYRRQQEPHY